MKENFIYLHKENNLHFFPNASDSNFNTIEILCANIIKPDEKIFVKILTLCGNNEKFNSKKDVMPFRKFKEIYFINKNKIKIESGCNVVLYLGIMDKNEFIKLSTLKDLSMYNFSFELGYKIFEA